MSGKGPSPETCRLVDERDQERCVRCGRSLHVTHGSRHHRQLRRHGDHSPANLILLCGSGTTGCHGWVHAHPALAYEMGWMLRSWQTAEAHPVAYRVGQAFVWYYLDREGGRTETTA